MPPLTDYTAAELASLAPEELAALETADGSNKDTLEELAGGADTVPGAAGADTAAGAASADTVAGAQGADTAKGAAGADTLAGAAATEPPAAAAAAAPAPNAVVYTAKVGDIAKDVQAQKDAIKAARTEKRQALVKMNDGEIDADEYARIEDAADAKIDAANDKLLEVNRAQTRAETAAELTEQQQQNAWKGMLGEYVTKAKAEGMDYTGDDKLRGEFNSLLRAFAIESADRGMVDGADMAASRWALEQAASIMTIRHPKAAAAAETAKPAAGAATAAAPAAAAARTGIPPSLGGMPAAAAAPVGDDVMSKINTLVGDELELYVASLPKDVANRLFASAQ
jgi:hypothetical protein